jgi:AhpD family alkylhydroperoxidase
MTLDERTAMLVAVGASIAANCQPCLEINVERARAHGIDPQEIADAVEVGRMVRKGAAAKMDRFAAGLNGPARAAPPDDDCGCGCSG